MRSGAISVMAPIGRDDVGQAPDPEEQARQRQRHDPAVGRGLPNGPETTRQFVWGEQRPILSLHHEHTDAA